MRKIINSAFVSLDGVTEDPSSWATFDPDSADEAAQALQALDGMLMGRGTYEYFADVMPQQTGPYADAINAIRKYVFSSTLESADWNNSTIIDVGRVEALKEGDENLLVWGSPTLVQHLMDAGLVDEFVLLVSPIVRAEGKRLFRDAGDRHDLRITESTVLGGGMLALRMTAKEA
jgi:dihydrofolate reductase